MQYTEKDLAKLIADVEKEFTAHLAKAEETYLAKSEDSEDKEDKKEEKEEKPEEKHEAKHDEEHEEKHDDHHEEEHKEEHEAKHDEKEEDEDHHDYDDEDMEHMEKMYRSMSKGEIKAHHGCIMKCMGKAEAKPAEMEKAKEMEKSEAIEAHGDKMEKSENTELELLKSELESEKTKHEELKKNFEAVQEFLGKLAQKTAPQGKAITSLDVIAKSEASVEEKPLTKGEIHEKLKSRSSDPTLKKSDRDAITSYYLTGQVNVNSISHLLK